MRTHHLLFAVLGALVLCAALPAQPRCTVNSVAGTWAYSEIGWTVPKDGTSSVASPVTDVGVMTIDYSGKITGSGTIIFGTGIPGTPVPAGEVLDYDAEGTLELNATCAGVVKFSIRLRGFPTPAPLQSMARVVYSPLKDEFLAMFILNPLARPLMVGRYIRLGVPGPAIWP